MPKLLYLITEDWFFCSHFLQHALAAKDVGYDVIVAAREGKHGEVIRGHGLKLVSLDIERRSTNVLRELRTLLRIWRMYRTEKPDVVHHIALKPIIYGSLAARLARLPHVINAPVGMGYAFTSADLTAAFLRRMIMAAMHWLINPRGSRVVFENPDDLRHFVERGLVRSAEAVLIQGSGVDLVRFQPRAESPGVPIIVLVARMLWDKGIAEFVDAARRLRAQGVKARFTLVGAPDDENPASIDAAQLYAWQNEGVVKWLGYREDIPAILAASHVVCLPSYREGLPKSLLEALAAGRAIVATNVPGCRQLVEHDCNGFLVPPKDSVALAQALVRLIDSPALRARFGARGRERAEREFHSGIVISATLRLYHDVLYDNPAATQFSTLREKSR